MQRQLFSVPFAPFVPFILFVMSSGIAPTTVRAADFIEHAELVTAFTYGYATYDDNHLSSELELRPAIELNATDNIRARLALRIRGESRDRLLPEEPSVTSYSSASRPMTKGDHWIGEVIDAYVDIPFAQGLVRLGKQQIVWGSLDGIKILDALNPQSFERFILEDFGDSRIGLWSIYTDLSLANWRAELALIPDTTTHALPQAGAFMAFTAPRFRFGQLGTENAIPIIQQDPVDEDGTIGLRLSRSLLGVDLQAIAISGLDFEPLGKIVVQDGQAALATYHQRRELYGISAETSFSRFALRTELSYSPRRLFNTRSQTSSALATLEEVALNNWRGALGLDINAPLDVFINLQFLHDEVERPPQHLIRERKERIFTTLLKRRFLYDTVDLEVRYYRSLEHGDRLFRTALEYELADNMTLKLAIEDFKGDGRGPFGQFDHRDQISLTWEITL